MNYCAGGYIIHFCCGYDLTIMCPAFINVYFSHYKFNMTSRGKVYKNTVEDDTLCDQTYVGQCVRVIIQSLSTKTASGRRKICIPDSNGQKTSRLIFLVLAKLGIRSRSCSLDQLAGFSGLGTCNVVIKDLLNENTLK